MLRLVALARTDVSEERSSFIIRVTRNDELGTTLALTINRRMLRRATSRNIKADGVLHVHLVLKFLLNCDVAGPDTEIPLVIKRISFGLGLLSENKALI
jgi:hypothetical protein